MGEEDSISTTSVVSTAPNARGWKGEDIRMPCDIQEDPLAVVLVQERISEQKQRTIKTGFTDGEVRSREERFDIDINFSLVISDLEVADEGRYYCQVVLKNFENFDNSTLMTISAFAVGTAPTVRGWKGEDIRLQCDLQEKPYIVYWNKERFSEQEPRTPVATFNDGTYESRKERFNMVNDFSLVITDLEVADEGRYYCEVALRDLQTSENTTIVTISSMASGHTIEECADRSQSRQSRCTYQSPSNTPPSNLTCVVSGFKPNVSMLWTKESGKRLNSVVSEQNTLSDGTYERFETITVSAKHGTEQTFMCVATGDSLNGTSTREITILPIHVSGKRAHFAFIIGLAIGLPAALIIVFLLVGKYLQNKHPDYLPRKGCGWNPCWRRPNELERGLPLRSLLLTKEQVQQCKEELKEYYCLSRGEVTVDPLNFKERVKLDDIYTNLSIIDRTIEGNTKTPITYGDLTTNDEHGHLSKRLLIQGEGGVGKTTLCAKIAWDWCQGRIFEDLDMVILIPLRNVTNKESIGCIVKTYLSDSNPAKSYQIDNHILINPKRIVIIFDGFDDYNGKLSGEDSSEVIHILRMEQYKSCKVIVTTRPWRTDEFVMEKELAGAYKFLNVEGFKTDNSSDYIERYFKIQGKINRAESLISFMEENEVIRANMAPFPIYCAMLCLIWNDCSEEKQEKMQELKTFSKIFGEMISVLKEHFASKTCGNLQNQNVGEQLKKAHRAIQDISEIAFNGLLDKNLSFPEEQFRDCHDAMETCCGVGVLTTEKDVIPRMRRRDVNFLSLVSSTVSFPHKLFQEYIAALYIENLFASDRRQYDKVKSEFLSRHQEFRYLLYFTSALGNELGLDIIQGLIDSAPHFAMDHTPEAIRMESDGRRYRDFCVDVAFECHTEEAARAVGKRWTEYRLSSDVPGYEHTNAMFEYHTEEAARAVGERQEKYELSSYSPEHTNSGVAFMVRFNQVPSLDICNVRCGRTVSRDLAESMCSSRVLRKVHIFESQFHVEFYKILCAEAANCQIQNLTLWYEIDRHHALWHQTSTGGDLARLVCTMPRLSKFTICCPYFPDSFLSTVAVSASSCQIQNLQLIFTSVQDDSQYRSSMGDELARWVFDMPRLSSFSLSSCPYLPDGFLSTAVTSASSCQIRELYFHPSKMYSSLVSESGAAKLAEFLCRLPNLTRAWLNWVELPRTFFTTISSQASRYILSYDSSSEDERSQETGQGSGQENLPAPDESETNN
ncbi:uncharacterized protein [Diadema setosum]|uniref:uncharacterized protein n=1 Tax=Diadema setosum TaxID=31175 RepID=UPI003B3B7980